MSTRVDDFFERLSHHRDTPALIWRDQLISYATLLDTVDQWTARLTAQNVRPGDSVAFIGDYSPNTAALLLALMKGGQIAVPLTPWTSELRDQMFEDASVSAVIEISSDEAETWTFHRRNPRETRHTLFDALEESGLVIFTSGSTGKNKAVLHDYARLLEKFAVRRPALVSLVFLLLDHVGGINTLLHVLNNGGTAVTVAERTPDAICRAIQHHRVELLPTSPTFINMLLMSKAYEKYDLSSLKMITFGTEPMPPSTLRAMRERFPGSKAKQTYGLTEIGILQTHTREDGSLWMRLSGEGIETKIENGTLRLRSSAAMLGYLNAPNPFDAEGWFDTQDEVLVDGDYLQILGRKSDTINVGGQKVFPAAVESVLLQMDNVEDVEVYARKNAVTGQVVAARFTLKTPEKLEVLQERARRFCTGKLEKHELPRWIEIVDRPSHSARFKKLRRAQV